jgi:hypothetical protein
MTINNDHLAKREMRWGRWAPAAFYTLNFVLWLATGIVFGALDLLHLALLPLPILIVYIWRTG